MKKAVFKNFAIFAGKLQTCNFMKKRHWCFLLNISKFLRTSANGCFWFFKTSTEHRWATASVTTFTLEPTITDLKLIWIYFKTSSNNIYPFPTVCTRLWKRNNDCFQFSRLHLSMIMTRTRWSMKLQMLQGCLKSLEYYVFNCLHFKIISHSKLKSKAAKNHYGNFYVFLLVRFRSKSVLISKI